MTNLDNPKCKRHFDRFLSLDKNEIIPLRVSLHLLTCAKCRTAVRSMSLAEKLLQQEMDKCQPRKKAKKGKVRKADASDPILEAALRQIEEAGLAYPQMAAGRRVSLKNWVAAGAVLILCLAAFPFTPMGNWATDTLGIKFLISFYIVMGLAVAAYFAIFIGCNMDFFVKRIEAAKKIFPQKLRKAP